jgi:hypothetical protein
MVHGSQLEQEAQMAEKIFYMATINALFLLAYIGIGSYAVTQWV